MATDTTERISIPDKWVTQVREERWVALNGSRRLATMGEPFERDGGWVCRVWFDGALESWGATAANAYAAAETLIEKLAKAREV